MGPTRFLPRTHDGARGEAAHAALANDIEGRAYCADAASLLGVLAAGDATLYDSRLHHCGGPYIAPPPLHSEVRREVRSSYSLLPQLR